MQRLGVNVVHHDNLFSLHKHEERRRLVAAHPSVFLYIHPHMNARDNHAVSDAARQRDHLDEWLQACHDEKAEHVVYVSTASPAVFFDSDNRYQAAESICWEMEGRLQSEQGIRHWTILRPVSLMSLELPSHPMDYEYQHLWEEPTRIFARCDPAVRQQLIAPADVGRIAALVLTQPSKEGSTFYGRTIELSSESLSVKEEAQVRADILGKSVVWDDDEWKRFMRGPGCCFWDMASVAFIVPALPRRQLVSVEATRELLPSLQDYRTWFMERVKRLPSHPLKRDDFLNCCCGADFNCGAAGERSIYKSAP